ncbi:MAG TPA: NAD-dependent epimerase/dehydratase family protein [Candidatus Desulfaltia sp.]|nr:NAD-dependent epimerase/dehydratase family protein [Candidatus Desulfaltia sp.]
MKALVTGATGFIGSHLAEELTGRGWDVRCLVRRPSGLGWIENLNVHLVRGDCRDKPSLGPSVEGVDCVFHLAGVINALSWEEYFQANVVGTKNLLEAVAERNPGLKKFIYVSSISAAGPSEKGQLPTEDDPCLPISDYGRSKLAAEEAVHAFADRFPCVIIRPPNVIGPRQRELREAVRLIKRRIKPSVGTGEPQTSLCYVGDVVEALILAAEKPEADGRTYFLAYPRPYAWSEVTKAIQETLGIRFFLLKIPYPVQWLAAAAAEAAAHLTRKRPRLTRNSVAAARKYHWIYDGTRIKRELGFEPRTDLKEAIRRTVAWNNEHGWA